MKLRIIRSSFLAPKIIICTVSQAYPGLYFLLHVGLQDIAVRIMLSGGGTLLLEHKQGVEEKRKLKIYLKGCEKSEMALLVFPPNGTGDVDSKTCFHYQLQTPMTH